MINNPQNKAMKTQNPLLHANACAVAIMFLAAAASSAETVTWDGSTDFNWTNPDSTSWSGGTYDNGDDAQFLGSGAGTITLSGTINPGSVTVNSASNYTFTGAQIEGTGTLTKDGAGTLILTSNTAYTGDTNINGGVMELQLASGFGGTNSDFNINNGSTLRFVKTTGNGFVLDGADEVNFGSSGGGLMNVVSGNFVVRGTTFSTQGGAGNTIQGSFNMDQGDVIFNVASGTDANDLTVSVALGNSAGIVKQGAGTMLATNVTYTGATTVDGGVLVLDESDNTYHGGAININNGATLRLDNQTGTYLFGGDSFNFGATGGNTLEIVSGHNHVWSGNNTVTTNGGTGNTLTGSNINTNSGGSAGTLTFNIADGTDARDLTVSTTISNGGGITKTGAGTLSLTGANSYTGDTNINGGVLELQTTGGFRTLSSNVHNINNGSTLRFTRNGGNGFVLDAGDAINFGSSGGGTLDTNVASSNNFVVRGTTFTTQGGTENTIQGSFNMDAADVTFNVADGADASDLTVSAALNNAAGIVKQGAGTMTLTGSNSYNGTTQVTAGTLVVDGTHTGAGLYSVASASTLAGSGSITAAIDLSGVISPGNSPGTLATGSQTWNDGGAYLWEINATADAGGSQGSDPGWDWLDITGALDLANLTAGGFTIDIDSLTASNVIGDAVGFANFTKGDGIADYSFTIVTASGGITGFDADDFLLDSSGFSNAPSWDWQIVLSGSDLVLEAYAVPEPSSTALLGLGGLALALRRRR